jgi:hypothetical protein
VLLSASACVVLEPEPEPATNDGDYCESDEDCSTGHCNHNRLCSHSACDCPGDTCDPNGEEAPSCRPGWICVGYDSIFEPVGEFFGAEPDLDDGYCQIPCSVGCPEHYVCTGQLCAADPYWLTPRATISWSGAAEGETSVDHTLRIERGLELTLTASATSPVKLPIESYAWTLVYQRGERVESTAQSVEVVAGEPDGVIRAELAVTDADAHTRLLDLQFDACSGSGAQCGYQGSGCCVDCDDETNTCL